MSNHANPPVVAGNDPRLTVAVLRWPAVRALLAERIRLLRLLAHARLSARAGLVVVLAITALTAPLSAVVTGWLVARTSVAENPRQVLVPLASLVAIMLLRQAAESLTELASTAAATRIDGWVRGEVRRLALAPAAIGHLDQPDFQNDVLRASDIGEVWRARSPGTAAVGQAVVMFRMLAAVASAAVLARYFPLLAGSLLLTSLVLRAILRRQWMYLVAVNDGRTGDQRRAEYWADVAGGAAAAKELRLFGLADWVMTRRHESYLRWRGESWAALRYVLSRQGTTTMLAAGSALAALLAPGLVAVGGGISASELATCLVAAWALFQISAMGPEAFDIDYGRDAVRAFDRLSAQHHREPTGNAALPDVDGPPLVHFDGVGFSYLGTGRPVLDNVDLQLRPGEVLGVVGVNGAGKTTLMKLLAGLYRPSTGRITVHGTDLAAVDLQAWRRWLAVLFQDFVKYPLTVADNVALAAPEHRTDRAGILAALRAAGAQEMVDTLPDGLDTVLWRGGDGGADLSGGQWQRLAIARMLFAVGHGRRILVLDEPTAHLDVQAEADFYRAVVSAVSGVTVVLISHRLPTLRNADRIVVLDAGAIVECGSHDALLEQGGTYARLFRLQAARFTDRAFADRAFADRDGSA